MEIDKFNGKSFELWKLKIEDMLVDRDQLFALDPSTAPTGTSADDWKILAKGKENNLIVSLIFNITECVRESYSQRFMG
jgi:hypothetical protein